LDHIGVTVYGTLEDATTENNVLLYSEIYADAYDAVILAKGKQ